MPEKYINAFIAYNFEYRLSRNKNMIAEIPDATTKKNIIIKPKEGVPNIKASKTIKQKAMIAIFLNRNDFSLGLSRAINLFSTYLSGSAVLLRAVEQSRSEPVVSRHCLPMFLQSLHQLSNAGGNALFVGEDLVFQMTGIRDGRLSADAGVLAGYTRLQDHRWQFTWETKALEIFVYR